MKDRKQLPILRGSRQITPVAPGGKSILNRMVSDAIAVTSRREVALRKLYRIGEYEFCEPDYQQITIWAKQYGKSTEELVDIFSRTSDDDSSFKVVNGSIIQLLWDLAKLPLSCFKVDYKLQIKHLTFTRSFSSMLTELDLSLMPELRRLNCMWNKLTELDLSLVPELQSLYCNSNQLTELDLSPVTELRELDCSFNKLIELDLSPVPELRKLDCSLTELSELDLSTVPELRELNYSGYSGNPLTELDLSPVPELRELDCSANQLTELDLSPVPELRELNCSFNKLTELDLSPVPALRELECWDNQLTELDLSQHPQLDVYADSNVTLIRRRLS